MHSNGILRRRRFTQISEIIDGKTSLRELNLENSTLNYIGISLST